MQSLAPILSTKHLNKCSSLKLEDILDRAIDEQESTNSVPQKHRLADLIRVCVNILYWRSKP